MRLSCENCKHCEYFFKTSSEALIYCNKYEKRGVRAVMYITVENDAPICNWWFDKEYISEAGKILKPVNCPEFEPKEE
ncbi:MAG: hypothetical protein ACXQS8_06605 [Candidatus Helarchaeales archaeon]